MNTLKPYSPVLLILLIFTISFSQVQGQPDVTLGAKLGASFSGFRGDDAGDIDFRKGVVGGLFVSISPVGFFTFQPELLFQQRGAVNENDDFNFREDVKIGYMNIPLLFKLRIPIVGKLYPHIYAGPQFSYAFASTYSITALDLGTLDREIDVRKYDLGGVFGFGLDAEINHLFLTADFRYGLGAFTVDNDGDADLKNKDIAILFGVGYKF